jgi:hypothetical protein
MCSIEKNNKMIVDIKITSLFVRFLTLFDELSMDGFSKYNGFFWVCWFLTKNIGFEDPDS